MEEGFDGIVYSGKLVTEIGELVLVVGEGDRDGLVVKRQQLKNGVVVVHHLDQLDDRLVVAASAFAEDRRKRDQ